MAAKIRPNTMSIMLQIRRFGFVFVAIARLLKWFARYTTAGAQKKQRIRREAPVPVGVQLYGE